MTLGASQMLKQIFSKANAMSTVLSCYPRIAIVDQDAAAYDNLLHPADGSRQSVHFLAKANDALWLSRCWPVDLWLINPVLPDMSGFELAELLHRRTPGVRIFIVGDEYSPKDELQTLSLGLTKYLCKPLDPALIRAAAQRPAAAARPGYHVSPLSRSDYRATYHGLRAAGRAEEVPVILPFVANEPRQPAA